MLFRCSAAAAAANACFAGILDSLAKKRFIHLILIREYKRGGESSCSRVMALRSSALLNSCFGCGFVGWLFPSTCDDNSTVFNRVKGGGGGMAWHGMAWEKHGRVAQSKSCRIKSQKKTLVNRYWCSASVPSRALRTPLSSISRLAEDQNTLDLSHDSSYWVVCCRVSRYLRQLLSMFPNSVLK